MNFLGTDTGFLYVKTKFSYKTWLYYIDHTTRVNKRFNQLLVKLKKIINTKDLLKLGTKLF